MSKRIILGALSAALICHVVFAAFLESDFPDRQKPQGPRPMPPVPAPPPVQENEVCTLIANCIIGNPYHYNGLTVFPISLRRDLDRARYLALDEAIRSGNLEVQETGVVSQVIMVNRSRMSVFGMAGEVLIGGKQNRTLREDTLLYPGRRATVPVYCVEKGRWAGARKKFESKSSMVLPEIRSQAARGEKQERVWEEISRSAAKLKIKPPSGNFQSIYDSPKIQAEMAKYRRVYRPIARLRPAGIVVCRFGTIVGADIFGSSSLFAKLQGKILDSYILDRLQHRMPKHHWNITGRDVQRYLNSVYRARMVYGSTPGDGLSIAISGPVTGKALSSNGVVVHLALFAQPAPIYREKR
ncbi:MAG TPA: hypothetical protein EYP19_08210 [Desulfobacterales bacterium]|nr:hypothetical protein [Desulfobacterales bacterium]